MPDDQRDMRGSTLNDVSAMILEDIGEAIGNAQTLSENLLREEYVVVTPEVPPEILPKLKQAVGELYMLNRILAGVCRQVTDEQDD